MRRWIAVASLLLVVGCKKKPAEPPQTSQTEQPARAAPQPAPSAQTHEVDLAASPSADHPEQFGAGAQLVLDAQNQPMIAYLQHDAAKPDEARAQQLLFVTWDAQKKAFRAPVKVSDRLAPQDDANRPLALARDPQSGALVLAFSSSQGEEDHLQLATSRDAGATWTLATLTQPRDSHQATQPTLAVANGQVHVAWVSGRVAYAHGAVGSSAATWPVEELPLREGSDGVHDRASPSLALDSKGQPAVLYGDTEGSDLVYFFQRPGSPPVVALHTHQQNDAFDGRLTFQGDSPVAFVWAGVPLGKDWADAALWTVRSDDGGKTWAAPIHIAGKDHEKVDRPLAVAVSPGGKVAVVSPVGVPDDSRCQDPLVARSGDWKSWQVCSVTPGKPQYDAAWPSAAFAGEKLDVVFVAHQASGEVKPGLLFWHEG